MLQSLFDSKPVKHRKPKAVRRQASLEVEPLEQRVVPYRTFGGDAVWSFTNLSYSYSNLLDGGLRGLSTGDLLVATREAMGVWAAVTPLTFTEVPDSGPAVSDNDYDPIQFGQLLRWGHHNIDGDGDTLAHGYRPGDGGLNGDMHFDDAEAFTSGVFLEVAAH